MRVEKLIIDNSTTLKETTMEWLHGSSMGGHSGHGVILHRVKSLFSFFFWKVMAKEI